MHELVFSRIQPPASWNLWRKPLHSGIARQLTRLGPHRSLLSLQRFAAVSRARHLAIRLEVVSGPACRRFHQDHVRARLLCSYRGPGTELAPETVDRDSGSAALCLGTGHVAVLRGHRHPLGAGRVLHRSPQGVTGRRLLLAADADPD